MTGWAMWVREHLVPFPALVRDHGFSTAVIGIDLGFRDPVTFFDSETVEVSTAVSVRRGGALLEVATDFDVGPRRAATMWTLLRSVRVGEGIALSAEPGRMPKALLEAFRPEEVVSGIPDRPIRETVRSFADLVPDRTRTHPFVIHRHLCEVADQWSFIEIPGMVAESRSSILLDETDPTMRRELGRQLSRIQMDLLRPFFLFDEGSIETSVYRGPTSTTTIHRLFGAEEGGKVHAVVVEQSGVP
jgi:hypothetical protein